MKPINEEKLSVFARRLRQARKALGLGQAVFADKIGVHPNTYRFYESDTRKPQIDILVEIAKALNVSTDWLLGLKD